MWRQANGVIKILVPSLLLLAFLVACGGGTDSGPTENGLRDRAEKFAEGLSNEKWAEAYSYFAPEYKSQCSGFDFSLGSRVGITMVKGLMGLDESESIEFRVERLSVDGVRGQVSNAVYFNGERFDGVNTPDDWVFSVGDWWMVSHDEDC